VSGTSQRFNLGTLASGGQTTFYFTVQTTNAGVQSFTASVGAPDLEDTNLDNNVAVTNLAVINYSRAPWWR